MPYFSIILQTTLKEYPGAATNRPDKLRRAIRSVIGQTFDSFELIVSCDNCQASYDIAGEYNDERIVRILVKAKADKWPAYCRNIGKQHAQGKYILYLDNDDIYSNDYLRSLHSQILNEKKDLYFADHYEYVKGEWKYVRCNVKMNSCGTANVIHSRKLKSNWQDSGTYGMEDWVFVKRLLQEQPNFIHLDLAGYYVCHKRGIYDI